MTVEEYRIAQLYMIAKKSREESKGTESGVEILVNEPYTDGPGGNGQFTHKIYHVGSHLPAWFKSLLPKSALTVEEEAWNAYPYTKTRFTCPFVEKFSLEIETYYTPDGGHLENVFKLSESEKRNRTVDLIDVVKDHEGIPFDDPEKDDPTVYVSEKTGRGPLNQEWIEEIWSDCQGKDQPTPSGNAIMCAYKLCKVEFRYWGMQTKIEKFIHDIALRKTMLKAHLEAWVWQDEWHGLTMEDIRAIEKETAELLKKKMHGGGDDDDENEDDDDDEGGYEPGYDVNADIDQDTSAAAGGNDITVTVAPPPAAAAAAAAPAPEASASNKQLTATFNSIEYSEAEVPNIIPKGTEQMARRSLCPSEAGGASNASGGMPCIPMRRSRSGLSNSSSQRPQVARRSTAAAGSDDDDDDSEEDEDDEFFDANEHFDLETSSLAKWSSMELTPVEDQTVTPDLRVKIPGGGGGSGTCGAEAGYLGGGGGGGEQAVQVRRVHSMYAKSGGPGVDQVTSYHHQGAAGMPHSAAGTPGFTFSRPSIDAHLSETSCCSTTVLILIIHGGSVLDPQLETSVRKSDVTTFRGAFESIIRTHYPSLIGHVVIKCVPCPGICTEALAVLSTLSPYSFDVNPGDSATDPGVSNDRLPIGTIPLFATSSPDYVHSINKMIQSANKVYNDFLHSEDGLGFCGQVCMVGDSVGSILAYDALCRTFKRSYSDTSMPDIEHRMQGVIEEEGQRHYSTSRPHSATRGISPAAAAAAGSGGQVHQQQQPPSDINYVSEGPRLEFDVSDFFLFGSPLSNVLAYRKIQANDQHLSKTKVADLKQQQHVARPAVQQMYNLFHPSDPIACRIEPLLSAKFSRVPPVNVPRYQKYPMGDGASLFLTEFIQSNMPLFTSSDNNGAAGHSGSMRLSTRRGSEESIQSGVFDAQQLHSIQLLKPKWWGSRRIDYALYSPEGLANFPTNCLPHLFHSSYWESADVISFVLRQLAGGSAVDSASGISGGNGATGIGGVNLGGTGQNLTDLHSFTPLQPREKWIKKRTSVKIRNGAANHRGNDVIVTEGSAQLLTGRFSYGPLDMSALSGEKVDVHIMKEPQANGGEWTYICTVLTDKHGKVAVQLVDKDAMGFGLYPVRMLVRGDHTMLHMNLAVVPINTETVVFSIDGSFAASMSVTGKDPKVKAGAVDVVRHWQELGYLIVYVTGRPDMQLHRVVSWLSQHNFPHGLVSFADGFTTDPLGHKAEYLKSLIADQKLIVHKAYGSAKDIDVYSAIGLSPDNILVVGKPPSSGKKQSAATFLAEGYAEHLAQLTAHGGSRPAQGNARMVIPRATFGLPGQAPGLQLVRRRTLRQAKRTTSFPLNNGGGGGSGGSGGSTTAPVVVGGSGVISSVSGSTVTNVPSTPGR